MSVCVIFFQSSFAIDKRVYSACVVFFFSCFVSMQSSLLSFKVRVGCSMFKGGWESLSLEKLNGIRIFIETQNHFIDIDAVSLS